MGKRAALLGAISAVLGAACGGGEGTTEEDPATDIGAATPAPEAPEAEAPGGGEGATDEEPKGGPAALRASPSCATAGSRVVLKLGLTRDHRVPSCYRVDDARVRFSPDERAKVTLMGPTSDGFCALDVEVPESASTGKVRVEIGRDVFESADDFAVPCP